MDFQDLEHRRKKMQSKADDRLVELCRQLRGAHELDAILDNDEKLREDPELRKTVRAHIQKLVPHLRDN